METAVCVPVRAVELCFRWGARILTIPVFLFLLGELFGDHSGGTGPTPSEWVLLAIWPIGMAIGLVIGWKWEIVGGAIAVACLGAFYMSFWALKSDLPRGPWFLIFTIPGFMFLVAGVVSMTGYSRSG